MSKTCVRWADSKTTCFRPEELQEVRAELEQVRAELREVREVQMVQKRQMKPRESELFESIHGVGHVIGRSCRGHERLSLQDFLLLSNVCSLSLSLEVDALVSAAICMGSSEVRRVSLRAVDPRGSPLMAHPLSLRGRFGTVGAQPPRPPKDVSTYSHARKRCRLAVDWA